MDFRKEIRVSRRQAVPKHSVAKALPSMSNSRTEQITRIQARTLFSASQHISG